MPNGATQVETFDYVLVSTGRAPNVQGIGLEKTSVQLDAKGVPRNDPATAQTMNADGNARMGSPIFIAGDASSSIPLLHEAADEGRIAGENAARVALGKPAKAGLRRAPIGIVFTDPQICIVGGGFGSLPTGSFATGRVNFEDQGRARILLRNRGRLNVYAETVTGRFLGAEMHALYSSRLVEVGFNVQDVRHVSRSFSRSCRVGKCGSDRAKSYFSKTGPVIAIVANELFLGEAGVGSYGRHSMTFTYGLTTAESAPYLKLPPGKKLEHNGQVLALVDISPVAPRRPIGTGSRKTQLGY